MSTDNDSDRQFESTRIKDLLCEADASTPLEEIGRHARRIAEMPQPDMGIDGWPDDVNPETLTVGDPTDTVFVTGRSFTGSSYHERRDCKSLESGAEVRERKRELANRSRRKICFYCLKEKHPEKFRELMGGD